MTETASIIDRKQIFYSLSFGANWGDNLTPLGDNILVINIAEQNKRPISFKSFFKLGFITTNYQLIIISIYYCLIFYIQIGIIILGSLGLIIILIYCLHKFGSKTIKSHMNALSGKLKKLIIG